MIDGLKGMNLSMEAQGWLIQEQLKNIDELMTMLLKILENSQKNSKDKVGGSSSEWPLLNKEKKGKHAIVRVEKEEMPLR